MTELKIHLKELKHQREALDAVLQSFPQIDKYSPMDANGISANSIHANPLIKDAFDESQFIDVKMETGTGKTYTYTKMMYELHEYYKMFKFIIVVPSAAIKEGSKSFLTADYVRKHFKNYFPNADLNVGIINSGDFLTRKGRKAIPNSIREFAESDTNNKNLIQVLLLSDKGFLDRASSSLFKDDYDVNLFEGESSPSDMISKTRPIVIIDEPHRLKKTKNSYKNIINKLKPEMIIRFGATFPTMNKKEDFYRGKPQYELTAVESFNRNLVKGVAVYTPDNVGSKDSYRVISATKNHLTLEKNHGGKKLRYEVKAGESLANVDDRFQGRLTYSGNRLLSNNLKLDKGMNLLADTFTNTYQEVLIQQTLDLHFKTERENFLRQGYPVKTNALFFIDNIDSYRDRKTGQETWLKNVFERMLKEKIKKLLLTETNEEYKEFLQATLVNIPEAHGGYFASDSKAKTTDEKVAEEVDTILRNKNKSLRFKNNRGKWNILRFFFSQWTLREGWDNPNVFTITKLRKSGSESSKIQEVGRGLRLPVDIKGNRLSAHEWWLNFIIDESEKDFANQLINEVNQDTQIFADSDLSSDLINVLKDTGYGNTPREIREKLYKKNIVDDNDKIVDIVSFKNLLPLKNKVKKIKMGTEKPNKVKLVKKNWNQIKQFWKKISKRYMIIFESVSSKELLKLLKEVVETKDVFDNNELVSIDVSKTQKGKEITLMTNSTSLYNENTPGEVPYNEFIKSISDQTNLPKLLIHEVLVEKLKNHKKPNPLFNQKTISKIVHGWYELFSAKYETKYHYDSLDFTADTSVLKENSFVDDIATNSVGNTEVSTDGDSRNLFEKTYVDSIHPEGDIAKIIPDTEIKVFGKIPRRAIQVPTYTGGTTTPDFIYVTKNNLYLLVEAKSKDLRETETVAVKSQKSFFNDLEDVKWAKVTNKDEVLKLLSNFDREEQ